MYHIVHEVSGEQPEYRGYHDTLESAILAASSIISDVTENKFWDNGYGCTFAVRRAVSIYRGNPQSLVNLHEQKDITFIQYVE